ncbi:hypothetical protein [Hydrogenophaga sp. PBL-H3]|uniref:hypothetical protein n=1 Tax=Hydrogenophaga sp. PBL-H3 TaxID=434010 RepID=UPI00131FFDDE|nr:hypothetical protein [Hydrogenophaga sp. PBL-H3]QHE77710.1 hypothetical protein F9Z45_17570 [Hydrogenophaga sp. PBL-H3]QHE82134.1 hypothetical protein F9Z44_17570 [Hydrogenophaga sp. PBL-H3]
MFKKFLYHRSLNSALLELGIETEELNPAFRDEVMDVALREHFTPKEAALSVLTLVYPSLSLVDRLRTIQVVRRWRSSSQVSEANYRHTQNGSLAFERSPSGHHS